jgi:hypothetical protein
MGTAPFFTVERMTGAVLIASFISFAIGGTLPIVGERGNMRMFNLPVSEHLQAVAANALVWRWANVWMGAAAIILLAGLSLLTTLLEGAGERFCSRLGLVGWLLATVLWVIFSVFRGVITVAVAEDDERSGRNRRRAGLLQAARAVGICAVLCFRRHRLPCAGGVWSVVAAGRARAGVGSVGDDPLQPCAAHSAPRHG